MQMYRSGHDESLADAHNNAPSPNSRLFINFL